MPFFVEFLKRLKCILSARRQVKTTVLWSLSDITAPQMLNFYPITCWQELGDGNDAEFAQYDCPMIKACLVNGTVSGLCTTWDEVTLQTVKVEILCTDATFQSGHLDCRSLLGP